jgi:hypothetical protein
MSSAPNVSSPSARQLNYLHALASQTGVVAEPWSAPLAEAGRVRSSLILVWREFASLRPPVELCDEHGDSLLDLVACCSDLLDGLVLWVGEVPVDVALAGYAGAGVAASHRYD